MASGAGPVDLPGADELQLHLAELDEVARFEQAALEQGAVHPHAVGARLVDDLVAAAASACISACTRLTELWGIETSTSGARPMIMLAA